uniref:Uncharacterized protein n=1 Tax=Strongyloides papillosus TaxID=174720 RepID=A0A0N5B506_STREA
MFLKLYWLGAALALMPLPTQPNEVHRQDLFPYITADINNTTFPFKLEVTTNSDMVLVKCPDYYYRHKDSDEIFSHNPDVFVSDSIFSPNANLFAWVPLLRNVSGLTHLKCGIINLRSQGNPYYDLTYNVMWKNGNDDGNFMERKEKTKDISPKHENCDLSAENHTIFASKREGGFLLIKEYENIKNLYVNQMFYYFDKLKNNERIKEPCGIIKIYGYDPKIKLKTHESTSEAPKIGNISKINLDGTNQQNIDVVLDMGGNLNYYQGEKIILKRMRYDVNEEPQVIENSTTSITTNFTINGYEIVELMYNYIGENRNFTISKNYYFGPSEKDLIIKEEI